MKYKVYNGNSFKLHTIKTDKFKTAHMEIIFRSNAKKEELCSASMLADILSESSKKYPRRKDLVTRFEELYRSNVYGITSRTGNVINTNFVLNFINPEYINEDNYLEEVLKLPFELILNPNVCNDEFDLKTFNLVKARIKKDIESIKEDPVRLSIREAFSLMEETPSTYRLLGTLEDLERITPESLYQTYKKFLKENVCDIFIIGNLDMDEVYRIIKKHFKYRYINNLDLKIPVLNKPVKKVQVKEKEVDNVQASLVMIYNTLNLSEKEKNIVFQVFNYIYGNGGLTSKLYQNLREKNSLCYGVSSMYLRNDSLLLVQVSLENDSVSKAITIIKKELKEMQKGNFSLEDINNAKNNIITSLDFSSDNINSLMNNYVFNVFDNLPLLDERKDLFSSVKKEEVINVSKKLKLNVVFTLKGKGDTI